LTLFIRLRDKCTHRGGDVAGLERCFGGDMLSSLEDSIGLRGSFHRMCTVNLMTFLLTFLGKCI
jgi:hypothetical protein